MKKMIKKDRFNERAYERLMIIYRKNKEHSKELRVINTGIKAFEELYSKNVKRNPNKKTIALSKAIAQTDRAFRQKREIIVSTGTHW